MNDVSLNLQWLIGDPFLPKVFAKTFMMEPKSYSLVFFSIFRLFFDVTIEFAFNMMRIFSLFLIIISYYLSKKILKSKFIAIIITILFLTCYIVKNRFFAPNYVIFSMFFSLLGIYFLIIYFEEETNLVLLISSLSILIAGFFRYELFFLLGFPYLFFLTYNFKKKDYKLLFIFSLLLTYMLISLLKRWVFGHDDFFTTGTHFREAGIISMLKLIPDILYNNIYLNHDLTLSITTTLFTFTSLFSSIFFLAKGILESIRKHKFPKDIIVFLSAYHLFYFFFIMTFTIQGLRSAMKYSIHYFLIEIIVTFYLINQILLKIGFKKIYRLIIFILFSYLAISISGDSLSFEREIYTTDSYKEYIAVKNSFSYEEGCYILKVHADQPIIDIWFDLQDKGFYIDPNSNFYIDLKKDLPICFYLYHHNYDENDSFYRYRSILDLEKIDSILSRCNRTLIHKGHDSGKNTTLIKYKC